MKTKLIILITFAAVATFGQSYTSDDFIQNFYVACKTEKFLAFQQASVGTELLGSNQYGRAMNKYNNAIEKDSSYCDVYFMLGYVYQRKGDYKESQKYCDKSLALNQTNPSAWTIKGATYLITNDTLNALMCFENAKKYSPNQIDGYYGISLTLFSQNKPKEALSIIQQFENNPNAIALPRDKKKMMKLKSKLVAK